jgi:hypothetical protein
MKLYDVPSRTRCNRTLHDSKASICDIICEGPLAIRNQYWIGFECDDVKALSQIEIGILALMQTHIEDEVSLWHANSSLLFE